MARRVVISLTNCSGSFPTLAIDILEQLPVPFGLIRYGVAPDHQSTKAVARVFDRVLSRERVSFFGNVNVGRDVQLEELMSLYDAVVLATGAARDRKLGIPGEDLPGVMGSGAFTGWYNGHPHRQPPPMNEVRSAVVIGNGNVAIDVARILAKSREELVGSDLPKDVTSWLLGQPVQTIHIIGRRGPAEAKFTQHELAELGTLQRARPVVVQADNLTGDKAVVNTLRGFAESPHRDTPVSINFHFHLTPIAFAGTEKVEAVQFRSPRGELIELPAQLAVTCIGYEALACGSLSPTNGCFLNDQGMVQPRLYAVGWAKRGPTGTIPTNRTEAQQVVQRMAREIVDSDRPGGAELRRLLETRGVTWVDGAGWRRIDEAELSGACADRCRRKVCRTEEMLEIANPGQLRPA